MTKETHRSAWAYGIDVFGVRHGLDSGLHARRIAHPRPVLGGYAAMIDRMLFYLPAYREGGSLPCSTRPCHSYHSYWMIAEWNFWREVELARSDEAGGLHFGLS